MLKSVSVISAFLSFELLLTVNCVLKRRKIKKKEAGNGPFFKKN